MEITDLMSSVVKEVVFVISLRRSRLLQNRRNGHTFCDEVAERCATCSMPICWSRRWWLARNPTACRTHTCHAMFNIHIRSCTKLITVWHSVLKHKDKTLDSPMLLRPGWSWHWQLQPCSLQKEERGQQHLPFICAPFKVTGRGCKSEASVIKIQSWRYTCGKIISSIRATTREGLSGPSGGISWHAYWSGTAFPLFHVSMISLISFLNGQILS